MEVSLKKVRGNLANLSVISTLLLDPHLALNAEFFHELANSFPTYSISLITKFRLYPAITIAAFILMIYLAYKLAFNRPPVTLSILIIIECGTRHRLDLQHQIKAVIRP